MPTPLVPFGKTVFGAREIPGGDAVIRTVSLADGGGAASGVFASGGSIAAFLGNGGGVSPRRGRDNHRDCPGYHLVPCLGDAARRAHRRLRRLRLRGPRREAPHRAAPRPFELASRVPVLPVVPVVILGVDGDDRNAIGRRLLVDIGRGWLGCGLLLLAPAPTPTPTALGFAFLLALGFLVPGELRVPVLLNGGGRRGDLSGRRSPWRGRGLRYDRGLGCGRSERLCCGARDGRGSLLDRSKRSAGGGRLLVCARGHGRLLHE